MKKKAASSEAAFALSNQILRYGDAPASEGKGATRASAAIQRIAVGREEGEDDAPRDLISAATGIESVVHASAAIRREGKRPVNGPGFQRAVGPGFSHAQLAAEGDAVAFLSGVDHCHGIITVQCNDRVRGKSAVGISNGNEKSPCGRISRGGFLGIDSSPAKIGQNKSSEHNKHSFHFQLLAFSALNARTRENKRMIERGCFLSD